MIILRKDILQINSCFLLTILFFCKNVVEGHPSPSPDVGDAIKRVDKGLTDFPQQAKIFEVDKNNRILRPWTKINENFETVLRDLDGIRLECISDIHPVQWLYIGRGAPILTSNVTFTRAKKRDGDVSSTEYVANVLISPLKEHHTGKYVCTGADYIDMRTYFYIYVPGPTLFSVLNGQDIFIPKNDSSILIPCTVSNPDVIVSLEKSINDVLQRVKPSLVTYDPKVGMRLDISQMDDPEGIYVCTARYNNLVRGIEYALQYPTARSKVLGIENPRSLTRVEDCNKKCGENAHCGKSAQGELVCVCNNQFKGNPTEECNRECDSHSDCPQNTVCFSDLKCRDPCIHSIKCGTGALCRVDNAYPVCFCPENFIGDAKKECINGEQSDAPFAPTALNLSSQIQCSRKCGDNALCTISNGKEACKCKPGLTECDIPCENHDECPDFLSCNVLRRCQDPCVHNIRCGLGASCIVINHRPKCHCPRDTVGDPLKECSSAYQGDQAPPSDVTSPAPDDPKKDKCKGDDECSSNEKCMKEKADAGKTCLNPCLTRRCGVQALCKTEDHRTFCVCKENFEGNANRECKPIKREDSIVEPLRERETENVTNCSKPEECGPNSKCTIDKDGKQNCICREGHIGKPPVCRPECERNSDCPNNHLCLRDSRIDFPYCARVCGKRICGVGSICREANGVIAADCVCPVGTGGDPYLKCQNLNKKLGENCNLDRHCGLTLRCETGATYRKCVDPCNRVKCGENLECSVKNHQAFCVCQSGFTGNSAIGCTQDVEFNTTSLLENPCGGLSCGEHSECRLDNNGRPSCSCRSYAKGEPPSCYQECKVNTDCEPGLGCIQKQCRHNCYRCGINTKCRISKNPNESTCLCIDGFEGNPTEVCTPKRI